jgi:hypothetical protein
MSSTETPPSLEECQKQTGLNPDNGVTETYFMFTKGKCGATRTFDTARGIVVDHIKIVRKSDGDNQTPNSDEANNVFK